jgi:hypothetical protein
MGKVQRSSEKVNLAIVKRVLGLDDLEGRLDPVPPSSRFVRRLRSTSSPELEGFLVEVIAELRLRGKR